MRRTKLQFGSTPTGKARPLGQTLNIIRRTNSEQHNIHYNTKFNLFMKFDSWKDRRLYHTRSSHVLKSEVDHRRIERVGRSKLNWVKRRTYHELNSLSLVRLMWSSSFGPGLIQTFWPYSPMNFGKEIGLCELITLAKKVTQVNNQDWSQVPATNNCEQFPPAESNGCLELEASHIIFWWDI